MKRVAVIGDGAWGTALAILLCEKGVDVTLWGAFPDYLEVVEKTRENVKFLPGIRIPKSIQLVHDMKEALRNVELGVLAVPTQYLRGVLQKWQADFRSRLPLVSVAKGIEHGTLFRPTQIVEDVLGGKGRPIGVLSGPSHAEEVARKLPTTVVVSSKKRDFAAALQHLFRTERFRVYTNPDWKGVELGGALKNVIALAAGICDGLKFGDNSKSALLARGMVEMSRLGAALGGRRETFFGLSGIGDLITTCFSPWGRNRSVGEALGRGEKLSQILKRTEKVAEGVNTARSVKALSKKTGVEMPISEEVYKILFYNKSPLRAVRDLMMRGPKDEMED